MTYEMAQKVLRYVQLFCKGIGADSITYTEREEMIQIMEDIDMNHEQILEEAEKIQVVENVGDRGR